MKKIYVILLSMTIGTASWSQILNQNFTFSGALNANAWTTHSGAGSNVISTTTGLSYLGFPGTSNGNAALVNNLGGEDVNISFTNQNTNGQNIYYSFLVNITDPAATKTGDYFIHLGTPGGATFTLFAARVFVRITATGVNFGISNTGTPTYGATNFTKNTTYLAVVKYTLNTTAAAVTPVSMWIIPSGIPQTEALAGTPEATISTTAGQVAINTIALRQGSGTTSVQTVVDAIKVGTSWESVTGFTSTLAGNWNSGTTWIGGLSPVPNSNVNVAHDISMDIPATINNLNLQLGLLTTDATNTLTIATGTNAGNITGGSSTSFVNGPLTRNTLATTSFLFPVGKGSSYRPVSVIPAAATAGVFVAEYFNTTPPTAPNATAVTGIAQNEYWEVNRTSGPDAQIQLTYDATNTWSNGGPTASDNITIAHRAGGTWRGENGQVLPGTSGGGTILSKVITTFSPFTFGFGPSTILPLDITSFNAVKINNGNMVSWTTANEVNVQSMLLERSNDGRNFTQLATIKAGNNNYQFTDATPLNGTNYYRLKIVDKDGTSKLSKVVAVINKGNGAVVTGVYPTITTGLLTLDVAAEGTQKLQFVFIDLQGRIAVIKNVTATNGNSTISLDASALANGMYMVKVLQNNNEASSFKIVKQ